MNSFLKVSQIISKKFSMNQKVLIMKILKINKKILHFRISINWML